MRRVEARRFGPAKVLEWCEVAGPRASARQVLLDVAAVPVLHLDVQIRSGWQKDLFGGEPPYVPGSGFVGRVAEIGPSVEQSWTGRAVAVDTGQTGGYVERAVADVDQLIPVPDSVDLAAAAAMLHDGRTALGLCEAVPVRAGNRVLVLGAAGGLGLLLVQLARAAGAHVLAAARGAAKLDLARELGAHATVDYSHTDWPARARAAAGDHGSTLYSTASVGTSAQRPSTWSRQAAVSAHGAPSGRFAAADAHVAQQRGITLSGIEAAQFEPADVRRLTADAYDAAATGTLRTVIGQTFPLARAADAHRAIEARQVTGKTVLSTDAS